MAIIIQKQSSTILAMVLDNMKKNVIEGVKKAQESGVKCEMPTTIEVDMALDSNGLPCGERSVCAARLKTTISL
jgi:hypothetical protein